MEYILSYIVVGLIAGWIAGLIMRGRGFGFLGNIVVGILGAVVGGLLFNALGAESVEPGRFSLAGILVSTVGAVIFLWLVSLVRRGEPSA